MSPHQVQLRIPFTTLLKLALFALLVAVVVRVWSVIVMIVVASLVAVMLDAFVQWMESHGIRRPVGIAIVAVLLISMLATFFIVIVPLMTQQITQLVRNAPQIVQRLQSEVPSARPWITKAAEWVQQFRQSPQLHSWLTRGVAIGTYAFEGIATLILVLVISIYELIEGKTVIAWLVSFAPAEERGKWWRTVNEVGGVVRAYMRGQVITCFICGGIALTTLTLLRVPAAVPLAVLAFLCDLVPVVGTIVMTIPAVMLALLVGPMQAIVVVVVYLAYHLVESYFIIPRIYGREMRLSTLTVLVAITVGGALYGAVGAVLILPFVAAYPIVERVWLRRHLPEDTVKRHERLESS